MSNRSSVIGLPPEAYEYYATSGYEARRLETGPSRLEFARTKQILEELLLAAPAVIVDATGGAGAYACWLARKGPVFRSQSGGLRCGASGIISTTPV